MLWFVSQAFESGIGNWEQVNKKQLSVSDFLQTKPLRKSYESYGKDRSSSNILILVTQSTVFGYT